MFDLMKITAWLLLTVLQLPSCEPLPKQPIKRGRAGIKPWSKLAGLSSNKSNKKTFKKAVYFMNRDTYENMMNRTTRYHTSLAKTAANALPACPDNVSTDMNDPENKRSLCPWIFKEDYNPGRIPATVHQAVRLCSYCIGFRDLECVPVERVIPGLLKKKLPNAAGNIVWTETGIKTTVGFTCAYS